jgi:nucleoside phosphorylase
MAEAAASKKHKRQPDEIPGPSNGKNSNHPAASKPNPKNYTVGWICAIPTEYIAAQELLDEEHPRPASLAPHDRNDYTLGKIGEHNVVIAVLSVGEYGTSSAASVASNMLTSFPNIRIGLMVGIAGGAPSQRNDIRLGDIVVSCPQNGNGGVFQHDFGKEIQTQQFKHSGYLNQPPPLLRSAVAGLMTQYKRKGHRIDSIIQDALEKNERLQGEYSRPPPHTDVLYQSDFVHPEGLKCNGVCDLKQSNLVPRAERGKEKDNPMIHYGLIASANRLMKNAQTRDAYAESMEVLCFEMEAAGLMNNFPCLVIRGICDYSDSHKNKGWQGYAAMTAAAYAKDLLCRIPPNSVEAEKILEDIKDKIDSC